jgi:hypothetical protein
MFMPLNREPFKTPEEAVAEVGAILRDAMTYSERVRIRFRKKAGRDMLLTHVVHHIVFDREPEWASKMSVAWARLPHTQTREGGRVNKEYSCASVTIPAL